MKKQSTQSGKPNTPLHRPERRPGDRETRHRAPKKNSKKMPALQALIIPSADRDAANQFWIDRGAGENTFSVGLVPSSGPASAQPSTHFIASAQFERYFPGSVYAFGSQFPNAQNVQTTGTNAQHTANINAKLVQMGLQKYFPGG